MDAKPDAVSRLNAIIEALDQERIQLSVRGSALPADLQRTEQIEAALERVVKNVFYEKIDRILVEVIEKTVAKEIDRIKSVLMDDASDKA